MVTISCDLCGREAPPGPSPPPTWTTLQGVVTRPASATEPTPSTSVFAHACDAHPAVRVTFTEAA